MATPIDINALRQALANRAMGGTPQPSGQPVLDQVSGPTGATPTGGPNVPVMPRPTTPPPAPGGQNVSPRMPGQQAVQGATKAAAGASGFDDETREISKTLIQKLLKYI